MAKAMEHRDGSREDDAGTEQGGRSLFLLAGVGLGALVSVIVALLRRRPASPAGGAALTSAGTPAGSALSQGAAAGPGGPEGGQAPFAPTRGMAPAVPPTPAPGQALPAGQPPSTRWPTPTKYVVAVILFLAVLAVLYFSRSVIPILIFAALLAFLIQPIVRFFQKRLKLKRGLSVALTFLVVVIALALIPLIVLPALIDAVNSFVAVDYQSMLEGVVQWIEELSATAASLPFVGTAVAPLLDSIVVSLRAIASGEGPQPVSYTITLSEAGGILAGMVGGLAKVMGPVISAGTSVVFTLLISLYLSLSGDQLRDWYPKLIPPGYGPEITALFGRIGDVWSAFLGGQFLLMIIIGVVVWLGNLALGNSNALLLGMFSGVMELIPNIGPAIALVPGVLMALLFGSSRFAVDPLIFALIVLAFYLLVQFLENQLIVPRIMGDAVDLPPLVVLIGVFVGASTVGIWGVLLATPIIATGREVFLYLYNKILEPPEPAFPPEEEPSLVDSIRGLARRIRLSAGLRPRQHAPPTGEGGGAKAGVPAAFPAVSPGQDLAVPGAAPITLAAAPEEVAPSVPADGVPAA